MLSEQDNILSEDEDGKDYGERNNVSWMGKCYGSVQVEGGRHSSLHLPTSYGQEVLALS